MPAPRTAAAFAALLLLGCRSPTVGGTQGGPDCASLSTRSACEEAGPGDDPSIPACTWAEGFVSPRGSGDCSKREATAVCVPTWSVGNGCQEFDYCPGGVASPHRFWTRNASEETVFELGCGTEPFGTAYAQCGEGNNDTDGMDYPEVPSCECECPTP